MKRLDWLTKQGARGIGYTLGLDNLNVLRETLNTTFSLSSRIEEEKSQRVCGMLATRPRLDTWLFYLNKCRNKITMITERSRLFQESLEEYAFELKFPKSVFVSNRS
jgi:hypothetical protein